MSSAAQQQQPYASSPAPEIPFGTVAEMHLGGVPWSIYNTYPPEQIAHLLRDSQTRVAVTEQALVPVLREAARAAGVEHVVVVDGEAPEGVLSLGDVVARGDASFDFD